MRRYGSEPDREDSIEDILSDYDKKETRRVEKKETRKRKEKRKDSLKKTILIAGICFIVLAGVRLVYIVAGEAGFFKKPKYWAQGKNRVTDPMMEGCIANMWAIRKAADDYYRVSRKYPGSMKNLYEGGFFEEKTACPASGGEYIFRDEKNTVTFSCPSPEEHRVKAIWCYVKGGAPEVEGGYRPDPGKYE